MNKLRGSHRTPRYVLDRFSQMRWDSRNPDAPWLARGTVHFLSQWLRASDSVLEYGSGRSSIWIARRVDSLVTVEHDSDWVRTLAAAAEKNGLTNIDIRTAPCDKDAFPDISYAETSVEDVVAGTVDLALVDGQWRDRCALVACDKLKPGGLLVVDDAHRYIPSESRSPWAIPLDGVPCSELWIQWVDLVSEWRRIWISDGVHDDVLLFKPLT